MMRDTAYFKGKKILIVGLARSGVAAANLLYDLGAEVYVSDNQDNDATRQNASLLRSRDILVELGRHSEAWIKNSDMLVVSPGVPNNAKP